MPASRLKAASSGKKSGQSLRFATESSGEKSKSSRKAFDECEAFHVLRDRYEGFSKIGSGAYGVVCSATELASRGRVAIKRVHPWADDEWDARHTLRELRLMRLLCGHPNIVTLLDAVLCPSESNDLFIIMELMETDLHRIIASKQALTPAHVSCLSAQLLLGIQAMHSVGVLHRDLKPGNLLVSRGCQLRITDFGLSRYIGEGEGVYRQLHKRRTSKNEHKKSDDESSDDAESSDDSEGEATKKVLKNPLTEYVVTRWYRCPEVLLAPHLPYTTAVDCWSAGCIFAELIRRKPIFQGKNFVHQVQVILERLGTPADDELGFEPRDDAARFLAKQPRHKAPGLKSLMPSGTPAQLRFAETLLRFNPKTRATVDRAIADPYFDDTPELPGLSKKYFPQQCGELGPEGAAPAHRAFRDAVLDDQGFEFGFENPSTSIDDLRAAVQDDVARVAKAREARLADEARPARRRASDSEILASGPSSKPARRHSLPANEPIADDALVEGSRTTERRPSRTRLFGLPLLRSTKNKKTHTRVRPSPSPVSPEAANARQIDHHSRSVSHVLSRLRSVSAR